MPVPTLPYVEPYTPAPPPTEGLDYADLLVVDLSKAGTAEGRAELAVIARDAMKSQGFMYVINHGYTSSQTKRIFDIANVPFELVPPEEKQMYASDIKTTGSFLGYKPRKYWHVDNGVQDQVEVYSINKDVHRRSQPQAVRPFLPEIEAFAKHCHVNILHPVLRLLALGLEMPEESLVNLHGYEKDQESYARLMKYYPRSTEDEEKTKNVWLKGHTDFGSITLLWSQPVAGLQILSPSGRWQWVKHIENALVINIGDAMDILTGGFYKATIHRVTQPPPSQRGHPRLGVFYFSVMDNDVLLTPLINESPAIQREGLKPGRQFGEGKAPTMDEWRKARTSSYGTVELKKGKDGIDTETVHGVLVNHYN